MSALSGNPNPPSIQSRRSDSRRVRRPLEQRLVLWAVALVAAPAVLGTLFLHIVASRALIRSHTSNVTLVAQTIAAALSGRTRHGWSPEAERILQGLDLDQHLSFIEVRDPKARVIRLQVSDPAAWRNYQVWTSQAGHSSATLGHPVFVHRRPRRRSDLLLRADLEPPGESSALGIPKARRAGRLLAVGDA